MRLFLARARWRIIALVAATKHGLRHARLFYDGATGKPMARK